MAVPKSRYKKVDAKRFPGAQCLSRAPRSSSGASGASWSPTRRVSMTSRRRGFEQTLAKARRQLSELADSSGPGQGPQVAREGRGRDRWDRAAPVAEPGHLDHARRHHAIGVAPHLAHQAGGQGRPGRRTVRQADHLHRPRRVEHRRCGGGLPLPVRRRSRLPPDEGPAGCLVHPDVPLDRAKDPCPCLLLRARPDGGPTHGPRDRAGQDRP